MFYLRSTALSTGLLIGSVFASPSVSADHNNPLSKFGSTNEPNQSVDATNSHCEEDTDGIQPETLCENESNEKPVFQTDPILDFSTQIDIRPDSCLSFFDDYLHTRRGLRIESALGTTDEFKQYEETVANFPVVDFISGKQAHIVKSKDLSAHIYNNSNGRQPLFESIVEDAVEIENRILATLDKEGKISATAHGKSTILSPGDVTGFTLHIIIQAGMANPHQLRQIELAASELEHRWGFQLAIIEIP